MRKTENIHRPIKMHDKPHFSLILIPLLLLLHPLLSYADTTLPSTNQSNNIPAVIIDGNSVEFSDFSGFPYISQSGRTMLPMRTCLETLGCQVDWDQWAATATATKGNLKVDVPIEENFIYINNIQIISDSAAVVVNGRTYLPLRVIYEAFGYNVNWDNSARTVYADASPASINGGSTGVFSRKQLDFNGFDGIQGDINLPTVTIAEKGDCPYMYFGFDWKDDKGNAEGGFQFLEDADHPHYGKWTLYLRQGTGWYWGDNIYLDQGSSHHLKFYTDATGSGTDLVLELDGKEAIRQPSIVTEFQETSVKSVISIAMSKTFDGQNCRSHIGEGQISNVSVSTVNTDDYKDFHNYTPYLQWRPLFTNATTGVWHGTTECIPSYLHYNNSGCLSIFR